MIIHLKDAIAGDRFIAATGIGWTVLWNHGGYVKTVSDAKVVHEGMAPPGMTVDVVNRDESLTHGQALSNVLSTFSNTQVVSTE